MEAHRRTLGSTRSSRARCDRSSTMSAWLLRTMTATGASAASSTRSSSSSGSRSEVDHRTVGHQRDRRGHGRGVGSPVRRLLGLRSLRVQPARGRRASQPLPGTRGRPAHVEVAPAADGLREHVAVERRVDGLDDDAEPLHALLDLEREVGTMVTRAVGDDDAAAVAVGQRAEGAFEEERDAVGGVRRVGEHQRGVGRPTRREAHRAGRRRTCGSREPRSAATASRNSSSGSSMSTTVISTSGITERGRDRREVVVAEEQQPTADRRTASRAARRGRRRSPRRRVSGRARVEVAVPARSGRPVCGPSPNRRRAGGAAPDPGRRRRRPPRTSSRVSPRPPRSGARRFGASRPLAWTRSSIVAGPSARWATTTRPQPCVGPELVQDLLDGLRVAHDAPSTKARTVG